MEDGTGILLFGSAYVIASRFGFELALFFWILGMGGILYLGLRRMRQMYKKS